MAKGFEKIFLAPGQSQEVCFHLDNRTFAVWDSGWKVYGGRYTVQIGSRQTTHQVHGIIYQETREEGWYQSLQGNIPKKDWIHELGYIPVNVPKYPYTINSSVEDIKNDSFMIRILYKYFEKMQAKTSGQGTIEHRMAMTGAKESPLRNVQNSLMLKGHFAQAMADFGNKKYIRGIWNLFRL